MKAAIAAYHKDEADHWVAELSCGHYQHVRHDPPWTNRPWVVNEQGRLAMLGFCLDCKKCDQNAPPDGR